MAPRPVIVQPLAHLWESSSGISGLPVPKGTRADIVTKSAFFLILHTYICDGYKLLAKGRLAGVADEGSAGGDVEHAHMGLHAVPREVVEGEEGAEGRLAARNEPPDGLLVRARVLGGEERQRAGGTRDPEQLPRGHRLVILRVGGLELVGVV
eukprot:CAMPEP_0182863846 /NCGR_PEP_ID=MMETSP0034_2-20130328/6866_1 /TAXON_ID=156128 /ORGANISM="Nephroselmis pyriformis, Strain CCMP717" /LENGTH=152 /DNA_ID=CAMNT_0024996087 /DNA_START=31 /DNA_END=489 /DNA_ORIENTATION=+